MKAKAIMFTITALLLVIVSCQLMDRKIWQKQEQDAIIHQNPSRGEQAANPRQDLGPNDADYFTDYRGEPGDFPPERDGAIERDDPAGHGHDAVMLDERLTREALRQKKDPQSYRMFVEQQADGTQIYRELGMYIIVNPNGEEVYLPEEI